MEDFYTQAITINQSFWGEADIDTRFEAGDQTLWNEIYGNLNPSHRKQFNFNRIKRITNMISGHQRRNRMSTIVVPVENGDQKTADQFTKIMSWVNRQEGILDTVSDSFHGSIVTGMNLLQVWMDFRDDPISGNIKVDNCDYNSFIIDPFFRKSDLSDCRSIWKRSYLTRREVLSILPTYKDEISELPEDGKDGKFQFMPENYNYDKRNLLSYDEFYYKDYRKQKILIDTNTGETQEWNSQDEEKLKLFMQTYPSITISENEIPTVKLAIVVQGKVLYDGPNPLGIDSYPFVPVLSYYEPQLPYFPWRVQGVVRGLRDAQYLYNRRKVIELDILESQVNSGWKYKENALVNPKDIFLSGQGKGIALKREAQMTDVEQIMPANVPPSMIELSNQLGREIQEISGVNEELLGSAMDDKAGILSMLRQGAGLTTLQPLFDRLDYAQKLLGQKMIKIIQANFTPGKVKRIIEEEPTAQFYNKAFGKYDAAVEEGLNTTTQKQMQFAQLIQLRELGVKIPDSTLVEAATLQNKDKLLEAIQSESEQAQQLEQMQLQAAIEEQRARTELAQARTIADKGLGLERVSRIEENKALAVERRAEATKDRQLGLLNVVKALKEIDDVDITQLEKLISLNNIVKQQERKQEGLDEIKMRLQRSSASQTPAVDQRASAQQAPVQDPLSRGGL
jgi:hypothetical protein